MSSNETLTAPAPIIDAIDMQAASSPMAEEQAYTYQRADGTVERARNAEDAIARCPVLGKLAIEAPDHASVLLELAAAGNAKMAAKAMEEPKKPTHQEKLPEPKPAKAVEVENKISESSPEQLTRTELPTIVKEPKEEKQSVLKMDPEINYHAEYERAEKQQREGSLRDIENTVVPKTDAAVAVGGKPKPKAQKEHAVRLELPVPDKGGPIRPLTVKNNESMDLSPIISPEIEQRHQVVTNSQEIDSEQKCLTIAEYTATSHDVGIDEVSAPDIYNEEAIIIESVEQTVMTADLVNAFDVDYEVGDTETVETYLEIRDLIADSEASEAAQIAIYDPGVDVLNESETLIELEPGDTPTIETFMTTQPIIEEVTLESIKQQSNKQPLEQTLAQLVECLSKSKDDEQLEPLMVIIKDIQKALPTYHVTQEAEETKLQITPEMTDKLLTLLRELGYQNPREALVNLINKFGFEFLIQPLLYMFQLTDEDNRKEFLGISIPVTSSDDYSLSRLSKLIVKLVMGNEPSLDSGVA